MNSIGIAQAELGGYESAEDSFRKALKLHKKIGKLEGPASVYLNLARIYFGWGEYKAAIDYFELSEYLYYLVGHKINRFSAMVQLALSYERIDNIATALAYYEQGLELAIEMNNLEY